MVAYTVSNNAMETVVAFAALGQFATAAVGATVQRTANSIQGRARTLAPFRTGEYRNSILTQLSGGSAGFFMAEIGTDLDRGYRLEQGFSGNDNLGRAVHSSPQPHFGPAADEFEPIFQAEIIKIVTGVYV